MDLVEQRRCSVNLSPDEDAGIGGGRSGARSLRGGRRAAFEHTRGATGLEIPRRSLGSDLPTVRAVATLYQEIQSP